MLHPDLALGLAKLKFRDLWTEAEHVRLIRLSRQVHRPIKVPPGLERLLRLKAEKYEAWADLQKLAARLESHPRWRAEPRVAADVARTLALGFRLQSETSADDRELERNLLQLSSERARLARLWCRLEGMLLDTPADTTPTESPPALELGLTSS